MGQSLLRAASLTVGLSIAASLLGDPVFHFSTGDPDGLMASASRPDGNGQIEIESADDFVTASPTTIDHATFTGLIPTGASLSDVTQVVVEIYRVFPLDSAVPPSGHVPTRNNSPSDVAFDSRDSAASTLTFTITQISASFTAANSVLNGINPIPGQTTGGEGAVTGQEVIVDATFTPPLSLPADHYFFVPQVLLASASENFFWLSAPKPIVPPGTPFLPDLQSWIRNAPLDPDWLRIGTDIVGGSPAPTFNAAFTLDGTALAAVAVTPAAVAATEGASFSGPVATFTDTDATQPASNFTASIDWGDGTVSAGTVAGASGSFTVSATHTWADEGSFAVTTTVTDAANAVSATGAGTAAVAEADVLAGVGLAIAATRGVTFAGAVATFSDTNTSNVASDFVATINWGDSAVTAGTVAGSAGAFTVSGSHAYAATGAFPVTVTLSDDPPGTATATATGTATVVAGSAAAVPTLDGFGLAVLVAALSAAGVWALRSR
jgi:hypothetical protein